MNKADLSKSSIIWLKSYLWKYKWLSIGAFLSILLSASVMMLLPMAARGVMDYGFISNSSSSHIYFFALILLALLLAIASAGRYFCVAVLGEKIIADLRKDLFAHILRLKKEFFDINQSGEIISRITVDAMQVKDLVGSVASIALRNLLMAVGGLIMMLVTSWRLSLMVILTVPFIVLTLLFFARKVRAKTRLAQDKLASANAVASENITSISTVQAFVREDFIANKFSDRIMQAFDASLSSVSVRALLTGFAIFVVFSSVIVVLYIGASDVYYHKMSAGTLGQFILYAIFAASSFGQLSELGSQIAQATGALERALDLKNQPKAENKAKASEHIFHGDIELKDVCFAYPARPETQVLKSISLKINEGEKVAFVGATGSGKTTIFALLLRFYELSSGKILFDGVDSTAISMEELRSNIAYVPQDVAIFNGSLYENISFADPKASVEDVEQAARLANAYDFIMRLPEGFNTQIGERGIMLSGGQKQRLAIARAFLKKSKILLLDEATSALDSQSEHYVQKALEKLTQGRTTITIAHRLATVVEADKIFVFQDGKIVEVGNHDSLVKNDGYYAKLAQLQFNQK